MVTLALAAPARIARADDIVADPKNGLSSKAFRRNALTTNKESLRKLLRDPLNDELFLRDNAYIGRQLRDPRAMAMMEELVECALDATTEVTARDTEGRVIGQWRGELGLCQRWNTHSLNEDERCQQIITACVMARVNAVGKAIPLSLRSEQPIPFSLRAQVRTDTRFRESAPGEDPSEGWPIPGFATSCPDGDCNWSPAHVGTCEPGTVIQLAIDDPSDPSACRSTELRACAGIHGCVGPTVHELPDGSPVPAYSKHLADKLGACRKSPLELLCPTEEATAGFYSVMIRPHQMRGGTTPPSASTVVKVVGSGKYPAPEADVFQFPEGAFYGNMFKPELLELSCTVSDAAETMSCRAANDRTCDIDLRTGDPIGNCTEDLVSLPYRNVYACYTYAETVDDDDTSVAALNMRLCDTPDTKKKCFPHKPRRCHIKNDGTNLQKDSLCEPIGNDGAFGHCMSPIDRTLRFEHIITTYLNEPCDLLGEGTLCVAMRRRVDSTSGCGRRVLAGAAGAAALATVLALVLRRRPRRPADRPAP